MTWNYELKKPLIFLCSVMPYNAGHGTYCLTSVDITFDSRESLYFAITFPENGRLFEKLEAVKGLFCKGLRGFARKCEISWSHPDHASSRLIRWSETLDFIGFALCENVA